MPTREEAIAAVNSERDYQNKRWNESTTTSKGLHSPAEWLVYMQDYLREAMTQASRHADPESNEMVMNTIRKITAMGVAAMEQNGAPTRK